MKQSGLSGFIRISFFVQKRKDDGKEGVEARFIIEFEAETQEYLQSSHKRFIQ